MTPPRIKVLPDDLINKIAAGEVIERPASVVKELVENAIDAQATKIVIEVVGSGKKLIRVSDNASGMTNDEIKLSIERHSTSKISDLNDLFNINSLGFRGEALPSISSISRFEIRSRVRSSDNKAGNQLSVEGGKGLKIDEVGTPDGTTVMVKDLFYNTPARKKFLKSDATEMGHISDIVSRYVMACPSISFELIADQRTTIASSGSGKLKDAVIAVYGVEIAKDLVEVSFESGPLKVAGLISRPNTSRIDRQYENLFVNGRYVNNFLLNRALEDAYRTLIPGGRYPIAVLFIDIDPGLVDVNVHPSKREVKFQNTQEVMNAVRSAAFASLKNVITPTPGSPSYDYTARENRWKPEMADILFPLADQQLPPTRIEVEMDVSGVLPLVPIYQFRDVYILATDGSDLVLIDQHAAHERILYDQLKSRSSPETSQPLLIPETIDLGPKQAALLIENLGYLKSLGFDIEEFGSNSFIFRSVPPYAIKAPLKQMLDDILSEAMELGRSVQIEIKKENILKLIACHSAIKAGDKLTMLEINKLIKDLYATGNPLTCPHGRPTMIRITEEELIKRFGR